MFELRYRARLETVTYIRFGFFVSMARPWQSWLNSLEDIFLILNRATSAA